MGEQSSLKNKTISGLFWSTSDFIANQGIGLIIQIFLARLLLPQHFGIIGMITIFIAISQSIMDSGFGNALIREKDSSQKDFSTVFYFNLIMAVFLYIVLFIAAPAISRFFDEPQLIPVLRVLSIVIIINSFGLIQRTLLIKKIDFKTQTKINVISSLVSGIIAIIFAYLGFGVWSLVIHNLIMQFIQSLMLSLSNRWIPSLVFSVDSFRRLFGFGWKLLLSGLIDTFYKNIYYVVIGKIFSATSLGYFANAQKIRNALSQSITTSVQKVSYPVLSSIQDESIRLKKGYQKIVKNSVFITFPIMIGLAAVAEPFVMIVFGEKWMNSIPYLRILCFAGMLFPLQAINLNILQVKGRSDLFLKLEIIKKLIGVSFITIVIFFRLGIMTLLWTSVINSYIAYFINSYYSAELLSYSTKDQIKDITSIFIISILMGVIVFIAGIVISNNNIIKFLSQIIIGVFIYIGLSKLFKIEELKTLYDLMNSLLRKIKRNNKDNPIFFTKAK